MSRYPFYIIKKWVKGALILACGYDQGDLSFSHYFFKSRAKNCLFYWLLDAMIFLNIQRSTSMKIGGIYNIEHFSIAFA